MHHLTNGSPVSLLSYNTASFASTPIIIQTSIASSLASQFVSYSTSVAHCLHSYFLACFLFLIFLVVH